MHLVAIFGLGRLQNNEKPLVFRCFSKVRVSSSWFSWGLALGGLRAPFRTSWAHLGSILINFGAQDGPKLRLSRLTLSLLGLSWQLFRALTGAWGLIRALLADLRALLAAWSGTLGRGARGTSRRLDSQSASESGLSKSRPHGGLP